MDRVEPMRAMSAQGEGILVRRVDWRRARRNKASRALRRACIRWSVLMRALTRDLRWRRLAGRMMIQWQLAARDLLVWARAVRCLQLRLQAARARQRE